MVRKKPGQTTRANYFIACSDRCCFILRFRRTLPYIHADKTVVRSRCFMQICPLADDLICSTLHKQLTRFCNLGAAKCPDKPALYFSWNLRRLRNSSQRVELASCPALAEHTCILVVMSHFHGVEGF